MLISTCLIFGLATMVKSTPPQPRRSVDVFLTRTGQLRRALSGEGSLRIFYSGKMDHLKLTNNGIKKMSFGLLSTIDWITEVDLSRNALHDTSFISALPVSTTVIKAERNEMQSLAYTNIERLQNLHTIILDNNKITHLTGYCLVGAWNLRQLSLESNLIVNIDRRFLKDLTGLTHLNLRNNQISNLPDNIFVALSSIQYLSIQKNRLTALSPSIFGKPPLHLKRVNVRENLFPVVHPNNQIEIFNNRLRAHMNSATAVPVGFTVNGVGIQVGLLW